MLYTVKMSCGHEVEIRLFGKSEDRERKIRGYELYGLCSECQKTAKLKEDAEKPFKLKVFLLPDISEEDGECLYYFWFSGNTMQHKDDIKAIGYTWGNMDSRVFHANSEEDYFCWSKIVKNCEIPSETEKAMSIGIEKLVCQENHYWHINSQKANERREKWKEQHATASSLFVPDIIRGKRWNQKIYGKLGNYSIYPGNEKLFISDSEADELRDYLFQKNRNV